MWEMVGTGNRGWSASLPKVTERGLRQPQVRAGSLVAIFQGLIIHAYPKCPMQLPRPPHPLESMTHLVAWKGIAFKAYG